MLLRSNEKPHAAPQRSRPQLGEASYTLLFHDDGTGRKPVAAYTFNFALELMKTEAETAARVCPVAEEEDVVVTAKRDPATRKRNFRVAADRHCQTILERVRQRLRRIQLPVQYARVGSADVGEAQGLAATNHQRRTDLEQSSRRLLDQLQQQRAQLERQWRALATQKEQWQQTLATTVTADRHRRHPLLRSLRRLPPGDDQNESQPPNHHNDRAYRRWAPAPPGTMTRLCEALLRLPDHHEKTASQPHPDGTR